MRIVLSLCLLVASVRPAAACGNVIYKFTEENKQIRRAEKYLAAGKYAEALRTARRMRLAHLRKDRFGVSVHVPKLEGLERRRARVIAVAQLRLGRVDDAVTRLRKLLANDPDEPYLRARLAEGLAQTAEGRDEALAILTDLEARDLMPDDEAWATLARLKPRAE